MTKDLIQMYCENFTFSIYSTGQIYISFLEKS